MKDSPLEGGVLRNKLERFCSLSWLDQVQEDEDYHIGQKLHFKRNSILFPHKC
jgi:hypothetical protein